MTEFDIAIIGSGPAGYTAAIYACRAGYSAVVFEKFSPGGQMGLTVGIENYPGFESIDGFELNERMMKQAKALGAVIKYEEAAKITKNSGRIILKTTKDEYSCRAVIIGTGASPRMLEVLGEREYAGRGVSYCATCDGAFFRKKTVAVVGGGDSAVKEALYLSNIANKVYIIHRRDTFRASPHDSEKLTEKENIIPVYDSTVEEIKGDMKVTGIVVRNVKSGEKTAIDCDGVFVSIGRVPDSSLISGLAETDENGYIIAGENCVTSCPGVFAVGDVRTKALRQIVTACADGANAVRSCEDYLSGKTM